MRFEGPDHWYRFTMSTGQRGFWGLTPEDKRAGIREAATRIIEDAAAPDGSVTFTPRDPLHPRPQPLTGPPAYSRS